MLGKSLQMIGLTGAIASGKSSVTSIVKSSFSKEIAIIDCDLIAREVVIRGRPAYNKLVRAFGERILDQDKNIDRKILGGIIFADKSERNKLDQIIQPSIFIELFKRLISYKLKGYSHILLDAPILFETKILPYFCYPIITVHVSNKDLGVERLMNRDKISREDAVQKINCQWPIEIKLKNSDIQIDNGGNLDELNIKTTNIFKTIIQ